MKSFRVHALVAMSPAMLLGAIAPAHATTIKMTGVVHTICEASLTGAPVATEERRLDLGMLDRRCNNDEGYRLVIHTPTGLSGAIFVIGHRRVLLSASGDTVVIDSNEPERVSEPAHILFSAPPTRTEFPVRVEMTPKGPIY